MSTGFARLNPSFRGPAMMVSACAGFAAMMAIVRHVSSEIPALETVFFRNFFQAVLVLPWVFYAGWGQLRTGRPAMHLLRAVLGLVSMLLLFIALSLLPLAEVTALSFTAPLFATVGAALLLREHVGARRWTATLVGFCGALVILRPGVGAFSGASLVALASAVAMAAAQLSVKSLSRTEHPNAIVAIMGLLMTPMSLPPAVFVWVWPSASTFLWLLLMGLAATIGQVFLVRAMQTADASAVMPFDFSRLIFTSALGWLAFDEHPDKWTWIGAAIICVATVYIARREAELARPTRAAVPPVH